MSDTVPTSRVGTQVGPYRLRRLLGRGRMGEVYEAHDTQKGRTVALKLMSQEFNSDSVFRRRMQREAHTAGRLQEPHIVPIHDYGEIDGQLFIDMRFIEGTDLGRMLGREGAIPPPRAVAIVSQVAAALDAAHRAGVVHRDIRPENILITGDDFAYLVDFGIAAAATDRHHLTKTGTAVGSWSYVAPERFSDDDITYRSDIYALACVLYDERCLGALIGYQTRVYKSSGYTAIFAQLMEKPQSNPGYVVVQGAVLFASVDQARGFVTTQASQWRDCAGKAVIQTNAGKTSHWTFRDVTGDPPKISLPREPTSGIKDVTCEHVLSAVANVVLDVNVCAPQTTDQASQIADLMAAKVPT
jgi:serine/threonine protein kinase